MAILTEEYKKRAKREGGKTCPLCTGKLDVDENDRGVIQFMDGWFWICGKCKSAVGKTFDCTQQDSYGAAEMIPYHKRSRRYSLKWLKEEYNIII